MAAGLWILVSALLVTALAFPRPGLALDCPDGAAPLHVDYTADVLPELDPVAPWTVILDPVADTPFVFDGALTVDATGGGYVEYDRVETTPGVIPRSRLELTFRSLSPTITPPPLGPEPCSPCVSIPDSPRVRFGALMQERYLGVNVDDDGYVALFDPFNLPAPLVRVDPTQWNTFAVEAEHGDSASLFINGELMAVVPWAELQWASGVRPGTMTAFFGAWNSVNQWDRVTYDICPEPAPPPPEFPPEAAPGESLAELSAAFYPLPVQAIILPEAAFDQAIRDGVFTEADAATKTLAVDLGGLGNDPAAVGVSGPYTADGGMLPFTGSLFIVARDPRLTDGGTVVQAMDYYVAAVNLSGLTPWLGTAEVLASQSAGGAVTTECCGNDGGCVPWTPPSGPEDPDCRVPCLCPGLPCPEGLDNFLKNFRLTGETGPWDDRLLNGLPLIETRLFVGSEQVVERRYSASILCEECTAITPTEDCYSPGFGNAWGGLEPCSAPGASHDVPLLCQQIDSYDFVPPICAGYCAGCEVCSPSGIAGAPPVCGGPPEFDRNFACQFVQPQEGSVLCRSDAEQDEINRLMHAVVAAGSAGCSGPSSTPGDGEEPTPRGGGRYCCGENCVCHRSGPSGIALCTSCDPDDQTAACTSSVDPSTLVDTTQFAEKKSETWRRPDQHHEFPPGRVNGERAEAETPDGPPPERPGLVLRERAEPTNQFNGGPGKNAPEKKLEAKRVARVPQPAKAGDPIQLASGSLDIRTTDLSFPGPVRPLEFIRSYDSQSAERSPLGSNWSHNWDVWLEPLHKGTAPAWASTYCKDWDELTCVLLHDGTNDVTRLFLLDVGSELFLPQAGSQETLARTATGWALRSPQGGLRVFGHAGQLLEDRDRFGNGFTLQHELTPLYELQQTYCVEGAPEQGRTGPGPCHLLAALLGEEAEPDFAGHQDSWLFDETAFPDPAPPPPPGPGWPDPPPPVPGSPEWERLRRLEYARALLVELARVGPGVRTAYGPRKMRPVLVTDDLGRTLQLDYAETNDARNADGTYDFSSILAAGLLETVDGPAGTRLSFSYDRPSGYASPLLAPLGEGFLVRIDRHDAGAPGAVPAPDRSVSYIYHWPEHLSPSYEDHRAQVHDSYAAFFELFTACNNTIYTQCAGDGLRVAAGGDPCALAREEERVFVSSLADNIIQVIDNGVSAVESRYGIDPGIDPFCAGCAESLDRVVAQRYGGAQDQQDPSQAPPDTHSWATSYPLMTVAYAGAHPIAELDGRLHPDATDAFLPAELLARYPEEATPFFAYDWQDRGYVGEFGVGARPPPTPAGCPSCEQVAASECLLIQPNSTRDCRPDQIEKRRPALPGFKHELRYYEASEPLVPLGRLLRTRLSCDQLARAQLGDPTHNDLLSLLIPVGGTEVPLTDAAGAPVLDAAGNPVFVTTEHVAQRITGRRARVARDSNRICSWSKVTDRDGQVRWLGFNYRGSTLVEAVALDGGQLLVTERAYNADGLVAEERRPTRGVAPWTPAAGYTLLRYDEFEATGPDDWRDWLPGFWARRGNLLRAEEHAAGGAVHNESEDPGGPGATTTAGRYTAIAYEPLFNQPHLVDTGTLAVGGADRLQHRTQIEYDYQELTLGAGDAPGSLDPLLEELRPFGFAWAVEAVDPEAPPTDPSYDLPVVQDWQLGLHLYGSDLDGDGGQGFAIGGTRANRGRGAPVRVISSSRADLADPLIQRIAWAPHGQPAWIESPGGGFVHFQYYRRGGAGRTESELYGEDLEPADSAVSSGYGGLLARVSLRRLDTNYPAANAPPQSPGCANLPGPYRYLLDASCSSDPSAQLRALGLPAEAVTALRELADPASRDRWADTSFSYSVLGLPNHVWSLDAPAAIVRDTDGRPLRVEDGERNVTTTAYSLRGFPELTALTGPAGEPGGTVHRRFDDEGNLTVECVDLVDGGCMNGTSVPGIGVFGPGTISRRLFTYWPEGELRTEVDPENLVIEHEHDARKLPTYLRVRDPFDPSQDRLTRFAFSDDGDLLRRDYLGAGGLSEVHAYDGLRRPVATTNTRGFTWHSAYSERDQLTKRKLAAVGYGGGGGLRSWETVRRYDAHGRLLSQTDNGVSTTTYTRTEAGLASSVTRTGEGTTHLTHDLLGNPVWQRDPAGNQALYVTRPTLRLSLTAALRTDGAAVPRRLTTTTFTFNDTRGLPHEQRVVGHGGETQVWDFTRYPNGALREETNPEGTTTTSIRNLAGWPTRIEEGRGTLPSEVTLLAYDARGQELRTEDPSNQVTETRYTRFGEVQSRALPGPSVDHFTYDALGRLASHTTGTGDRLEPVYDARGDRFADEWANAPVAGGFLRRRLRLVERQFDDLGRLTSAWDANPVVAAAGVAARVTMSRGYDDLGRTTRDALQVNARPERAVTSSWTADPTGWTRLVDYPEVDGGRTRWMEAHDLTGRLASKTHHLRGGGSLTTSFRWLGDLYRGRDQELVAGQSPLREAIELDGLGRSVGSRFTALDLTAAGSPVRRAEGNQFCLGLARWDASGCSGVLAEGGVIRDVMGRAGSVSWRFGHPIAGKGGVQSDARHLRQWRGHTYDLAGRLTRVWEEPGDSGGVDTSGLVNHTLVGADIDALGRTERADAWDFHREPSVGGLLSVQNASTGVQRFHLPEARTAGHRLAQVELDGTVEQVEHDNAGRVTADGRNHYLWDPRGRLAGLADARGRLLEGYAYDATGRLAATIDRRGQLLVRVSTRAYDGVQVVAEFDTQNRLNWEAAWGPGLDQLIEWRDARGGGHDALAPIVDSRNSVVALWDGQRKAMSDLAEFDASGRVTIRDADEQPSCAEPGTGDRCGYPAEIPFGFQSAWRSETSGLVYMRNRWYSPELGEFVSQDPLGYVDSYNLYAYAGFDPINGWDPFGLRNIGFHPPAIDRTVPSWIPRAPPGIARETIEELGKLVGDPEAPIPSRLSAAGKRTVLGSVTGLEDMGREILDTPAKAYSDMSEAAQHAGRAGDATGWTQTAIEGSEAVGYTAFAFVDLLVLATIVRSAAGGAADTAVGAWKALFGAGRGGIRFAQRGVSAVFRHGEFAGRTIEDVASGLRSGAISPDRLPVQVVVRDGVPYTVNNRSLMALRRAGMEPTIVKDVTGDAFFEKQITERFAEMGGPPSAEFVPAIRGGGK